MKRLHFLNNGDTVYGTNKQASDTPKVASNMTFDNFAITHFRPLTMALHKTRDLFINSGHPQLDILHPEERYKPENWQIIYTMPDKNDFHPYAGFVDITQTTQTGKPAISPLYSYNLYKNLFHCVLVT